MDNYTILSIILMGIVIIFYLYRNKDELFQSYRFHVQQTSRNERAQLINVKSSSMTIKITLIFTVAGGILLNIASVYMDNPSLSYEGTIFFMVGMIIILVYISCFIYYWHKY
jgi:sterol desaturase/sphingolipid hydroxylase (fatty acid hydroxylase superfamily)